MQRRAFQGLFLTTLKYIPNVQRPPCSCFHLSRSQLYSQEPSWKTTCVEKRSDFSDLNPDEFGTLRPQKDIDEIIKDLPDEKEVFDVTNEEGRKNRRSLEYYENLIKKLLNEKKIVEAIDVMETRMLKRDKVHPGYYVFNLLINGCAKVGYPLKAFKLYKSMKDRNIKTTPATYTGLFNACANSPYPEEALIKLNHLRKVLADNGVELNLINYNALIKAYARLKDVHAAFLVVDEMMSKGFSLQDETCCFLLQACISDTSTGLRHALLVWHKMRAKKLTPNLYHYNLLLRCIRDCGLGDEDEVKDVIQKIMLESTPKNWKTIDSGETKESNLMITCENKSNDLPDSADKNLPIVPLEENIMTEENRPNLLCKRPHLGSILSVRAVKTAADRLLLLGGFKTILEQMKEDKVKPNIKTFTQLLNIMPSSIDAEKHLLKEIRKHGVDLDIDFCNMLMKQRAFRRDYEGAKEVLSLIQSKFLNPDIVTFGILAMSCQKILQAEELLNNMRDFGYRLNIEILGAMLSQACIHLNFEFVIYLLRLTRNVGIKPNKTYMERLELLDQRMNELLKQKKGKSKSLPEFMNNSHFLENYRMFKEFYDKWKNEVTVFVPPHPYKQFRKSSEASSGDTISYKEKITKKKWNESNKQPKPNYDDNDDESSEDYVKKKTEKRWSQNKKQPKPDRDDIDNKSCKYYVRRRTEKKWNQNKEQPKQDRDDIDDESSEDYVEKKTEKRLNLNNKQPKQDHDDIDDKLYEDEQKMKTWKRRSVKKNYPKTDDISNFELPEDKEQLGT